MCHLKSIPKQKCIIHMKLGSGGCRITFDEVSAVACSLCRLLIWNHRCEKHKVISLAQIQNINICVEPIQIPSFDCSAFIEYWHSVKFAKSKNG